MEEERDGNGIHRQGSAGYLRQVHGDGVLLGPEGLGLGRQGHRTINRGLIAEVME